jgi:hypothetical protein
MSWFLTLVMSAPHVVFACAALLVTATPTRAMAIAAGIIELRM